MTAPKSLNDLDDASGRCPTCEGPRSAPFAPFCSKRCADVDLHRWLTGGYAIPAVEIDDPDAEDYGAE